MSKNAWTSGLRIPTISVHGIPGKSRPALSVVRAAAAPTISISLTGARTGRDRRKDRCRDRPAVRVEAARARPRRNDTASDAAAGICLGPVSSSLRTPEFRGTRDVLANVPTRILRGSRINFAPARECGQFHFQTGHAQ